MRKTTKQTMLAPLSTGNKDKKTTAKVSDFGAGIAALVCGED
jgi:hypothetical protein